MSHVSTITASVVTSVAGAHPALAPVPRVTTEATPAARRAPAAPSNLDRRTKLAILAEEEASKKLKWTGPTSEAEKYLKPLREPMRLLGHIGRDPIFVNWCAAFVTWCSRESGYQIPDQPTGFWATMALVESWKFWGDQQHLLIAPDLDNLLAGDILLYEWFDGDSDLDHIGIFLRRRNGKIDAAEGNATGARSEIASRSPSNVKAALRLPA